MQLIARNNGFNLQRYNTNRKRRAINIGLSFFIDKRVLLRSVLQKRAADFYINPKSILASSLIISWFHSGSNTRFMFTW